MHNSLMNILQEIFNDHYEEIKYTLHPRKTEMENIDKMINCGDPSFGGAINMPCSALPPCLLNWSMLHIGIVFLLLTKTSGTSF